MAATDGLPRVEYEDIVSGQGTLNKDIYKKQSNKVGILFDDGDVLFGKLRPYLKNWLFAAFKGIAVGDFWVLRANNADGEYIYTLLQIDTFQNIANQATGTKMPRADWSLVSKQQFFIPRTIAEQHRIGVVFKQLDNLITLHQRKDFSMRCGYDIFLKMVNTQKMANAWEQRKLGEVGKAQSGVGFPDREQGGKAGVPFYKVSDMNNAGNEHEMCTANNYVSEAQCKKNGWTPITEISVVFAKVGAAIMLNRKRLVRISFLLDNNTMAYKFGTEWDIDFGKTLFERIDLTDLVQIGALPSYNATDVECVEISLPDKPEQHRIGVLFKQLDNLITLHQREHRQKKNPFLNENRSLFREAIANAWEQRKLGDTIDFYSGLTYSPSDVVKDNGVFVLRSSNVREGEIVDEDNVYVRAGAVNSDNVNIGDIIVVVRNGSRSLIGKHAKIKKNMPQTVIGAFMTGLRYENSSYLNAVLNTSIFEKEIEKDLGATINQITTGAFKKMVFPFPKQHEQLQIGDFFEQIDNLITLHQCGLIKIQGDKNGKKRSFRRIVQRLF